MRISEAAFPNLPGVYIVWEDGFEQPLYIGQAGSSAEVLALERKLIGELQPRLNSGRGSRELESKATIESRWKDQHLKPRAGGSALRRSLGLYLGLVERKLSRRRDGRYYRPEVEWAITDFLLGCSIEFRRVRGGAPVEWASNGRRQKATSGPRTRKPPG